ncbi:glycosyltransferase family 4 protein [Paenibacillus nasutitermitis]|uniref:Glycosyltransferase EpsD n=1 Tax=Paenibacillus nasutitermitis TaxID=1652958 RepID=A0A916Z2P5_9BACL|nr:glycosyltransferase family 4 protein [Paenibacillus nasutitermitis]GGD73374.1 putative glycosyltransferase EpsD [Paenibacillus nasutitermitis]
MPPKILFVATVDTHFRAFHLPVLEWFKTQGWEVHVAAKGEHQLPFTDKKFNIAIERSPLRSRNLKACRQLKALIAQHNYQIVHCHTPMGGVLTRLAARSARKNGTRVLYTAHGFHFCKGAPLLNWLFYYPVEKALAHLTDCLITINEEDYRLAAAREFKVKRLVRVHGVGVDNQRYAPAGQQEKARLRHNFNFGKQEILFFYAAEFNGNKNHQLLIHALARIKGQTPTLKLLLAGDGPLLEECRSLATTLGVQQKIAFLGYRNDIDRLLPMCDAAAASSLREGLPVNILEAMACGLPIVATANRGHSELVRDGRNGFVVPADDVSQMASRLLQLYQSGELRKRMGAMSLHDVAAYSITQVLQELEHVYSKFMTEDSHETQSQYHRAYL